MTQDKTVSPTPVAIDPNTFEKTPELEQWLDSAIRAKVKEGGLTFDNPQNNPEQTNAQKVAPNPSIDLGRFGFKNPNDLKEFLLTPAGDTVKAEIGAKIELDETIKKQQEFQIREDEAMKHRLKSMLFLYLVEKQSHAAKQLQELVVEQNEKAIKQSAPDAKATQRALDQKKADPELQKALVNYDTAINSQKEQHQNLVQEEQKLQEQSEKLEKQTTEMGNKFQAYQNSFKEIDKSTAKYEKMSDKKLDAEIEKLETKIKKQADKVNTLTDDDEIRALVNKQNALNLKLMSLEEIRAHRQKDTQEKKSFYNAQGKEVSSLKEADFVVPSTKKIAVKDGQHLLLDKDDDVKNLSEEKLKAGKASFESSKHELMSIKSAVKNSQKLETEFHSGRVSDTKAKLDANRAEQSQVQNQIRLLESSRATAQTAAQQQSPGAGPSGAPTPSPSMSAPSSSKSSSKISAAVSTFIESNQNACLDGKMSPKSLFALLNDKGPKNAQDKAEMQKYIASQLRGIPSTTPIPFQTMQGLLKNMPRFGLDPNKPGLTPIPDPLDMKKEQSQINEQLDNNLQKEASTTPKTESETQLTDKKELGTGNTDEPKTGTKEEEAPDSPRANI